MQLFTRYGLWPLFFTSQLIALALFSWHLMAQIHFAYPLGYKLLDLQTHIARFAPRNNYKQGFEQVSPADHWRLFGEISDAVQASGQGLSNISYNLTNGESIALMHQAEIIHLQDVANLIDKFYQVGLSSWLLWLGLIALAYQQKLHLPSLKKTLLGFVAGFSAIGLSIVAIGAKEIFYWLHEQIFPDDHQWFFYYQDSLMTTLMKAPDIFAFIAVLLVGILVVCWGVSLWGVGGLLLQRKNNCKPP